MSEKMHRKSGISMYLDQVHQLNFTSSYPVFTESVENLWYATGYEVHFIITEKNAMKTSLPLINAA